MKKKNPRISREIKTVAVMITIYCRKYHSADELCPQCEALLEYARKTLDKCIFSEGKTTCARCPVHCYRPEMRQKIRILMRYSGPRMIYKHPMMAIRHLMDGRREEPLSIIKK
jgi:predicted amidophosphoribosyltransferase